MQAMDQTSSLGWTLARAVSRRTVYKRVLGVNLVLHVVIGLFAIIAPATLSQAVGLSPASPAGWLRAWGGMLLLVTLLYLPGLLDPVRVRWPNIVGILGRFGMAILFLAVALAGGQALRGFLWFALFDLAFAIALAMLYFRLFEAELMSRP
jgi:hypothetical protein